MFSFICFHICLYIYIYIYMLATQDIARGNLRSFTRIFPMQDYGHRVRLATHSNFKEFVLTAGLEFYPLGGDPKVLAGCMYLNALSILELSW